MNESPTFTVPSAGSTVAFLGIIAFVCGAWVWAAQRAWPERPRRAGAVTVGALALVLGLTATLARVGAFSATIGSPLMALYVVASNATAMVLAVSFVGKRFAASIPVWALVGVHGFRLPLELVLHRWYEHGTLPVQMTYSGDNWDIVTGTLAVVVALCLPRSASKARWWVVCGFTAVGLVLLLRVMSIALRSLPWPLRTYSNEPPVLLPFHAPYTWILPICVSGALFAHLVVVRWLWTTRHQRR